MNSKDKKSPARTSGKSESQKVAAKGNSGRDGRRTSDANKTAAGATTQESKSDSSEHADLHAQAAEHHRLAAEHHAEAATHFASGDEPKGAHHAHVASGHGLLAKQRAYEANMHFSRKHGASHH